MYDIAIIGAGPAGMTAAIYAIRAGYKAVLFEGGAYGGQITTTQDIENYPGEMHISGLDFATKLYNQASELGAEFIFEKVDRIDGDKKIYTEDGEYQARSIIIATGTQNRRLGLENENKYIGHGISFCATCDGALYKDKDVAVFGGGNTALDAAMYLSDIAAHVHLIHRRDEFRGDALTVEKLKAKGNVIFILSSIITEVSGDTKLERITVSSGDGQTRDIDVSGLFLAIGHEPKVNFIEGVELDEAGYINAGEDCHTNISGVFVAGDVRSKILRQLVTAESDGAIAAEEAVKYLREQQ